MGDGCVDGDGPDGDVDHPRREPGAVGDRTADECGGDDREAELKSHEEQFGYPGSNGGGIDAEQPEVVEVPDQAAARILAERQ